MDRPLCRLTTHVHVAQLKWLVVNVRRDVDEKSSEKSAVMCVGRSMKKA